MAALISKGLASLNDLQTIYGTEDYYDLLEIAAVDSFNKKVLNTPR